MLGWGEYCKNLSLFNRTIIIIEITDISNKGLKEITKTNVRHVMLSCWLSKFPIITSSNGYCKVSANSIVKYLVRLTLNLFDESGPLLFLHLSGIPISKMRISKIKQHTDYYTMVPILRGAPSCFWVTIDRINTSMQINEKVEANINFWSLRSTLSVSLWINVWHVEN